MMVKQPTQEKAVLIRYLRSLEAARGDVERFPYHMKDTELHQVMLSVTDNLNELIALVEQEIDDLDHHRRLPLEAQTDFFDELGL